MPPATSGISAAIEVAATPERVWAVLTDLASYPQSNPVFREASGQVAVGNRITLTSTQPATGLDTP
ncbi:MAG: SRPBCC family protein [Streptosporangiaceae bacterium]